MDGYTLLQAAFVGSLLGLAGFVVYEVTDQFIRRRAADRRKSR